jgi:hypothetical protein
VATAGLPDGILLNKNTNLGKFVGPWNGKGLVFLWSFDIFYGNLVM